MKKNNYKSIRLQVKTVKVLKLHSATGLENESKSKVRTLKGILNDSKIQTRDEESVKNRTSL